MTEIIFENQSSFSNQSSKGDNGDSEQFIVPTLDVYPLRQKQIL